MSEEEGAAPTGGEEETGEEGEETAPPAASETEAEGATEGEETAAEEAPPEASAGEEEGEDGEEEEGDATVTESNMTVTATGTGADDDDDGEEEEDEEEGDEGEGEGRPIKKKEVVKKKKPSIHLSQKALKSKERDSRRNELDPRHDHMIQMAGNLLEMTPEQLVEFVIDSQDHLRIFQKFFEKDGLLNFMFSFKSEGLGDVETTAVCGPPPLQPGEKRDKTRSMVITEVKKIPNKGYCVYFQRMTKDRISTKTIETDIFIGMFEVRPSDEPGADVERDNLPDFFKSMFSKSMQGNYSWNIIKDPDRDRSVRIRFVPNIDFDQHAKDAEDEIYGPLDLRDMSPEMDDIIENHLKTSDDVLEASKNPDVVNRVEHTVMLWCKNCEKVLATSKNMRHESDTMGPYAELLVWRTLQAKMCYIISQIQQLQVQHFIQVLIHSKSRVIKRWKDLDQRLTDEYHEAKDNVRYMATIEKYLLPVYYSDPPGMVEHINTLMYVIRTIHTTSRYYNTCEKVTALMVKISNQVIACCRRYITEDDTQIIWNLEKHAMLDKLHKCIELYEVYRGAYEATQAELASNPSGKQFNLSVNKIFGRFEQFCDRLKKIIQIVEIFNLYTPVHESHIDGLPEISARLLSLHAEITSKEYNPLNFREPYFDDDYVIIRAIVDDIQEGLEKFMDSSIKNCPSCMHGLILLARFKNLRNPCLDIDGMNTYLYQFYHNEIEMILQIYEAEKNNTPIPRGYPPFAGKIAWARHLYRRLERPMKWFEQYTNILKRDDAKSTVKLFNVTCKKLVLYEMLVHESWVKACNSMYEALAPVLTRQEFVQDPFFRQIIDETEIIQKLGLEVPDIAQLVYYKQEQIFKTYEKVKTLAGCKYNK